MKNSSTNIHYDEKIRPYSKYSQLLCEYLADEYFKARVGKILDVGKAFLQNFVKRHNLKKDYESKNKG